MMRNKSRAAINTCSSSAKSSSPDYDPYVASKWAQAGHTTSIARSVHPYGIHVNGINSVWVVTDMARREMPCRNTPWSTPADMAEASLYLVTKASRDMTGQFIELYES